MRETKDADFPWWLVILGVTGLWLGYEVWASAIYSQVMGTLVKGIQVTVAVTLVAYASACALGLSLAVAGLSRYVVLRQAARVWIEVIRGVPIMVLLLYVAFVDRLQACAKNLCQKGRIGQGQRQNGAGDEGEVARCDGGGSQPACDPIPCKD